MAGLAETVEMLTHAARQRPPRRLDVPDAPHLVETVGFGADPGNLRMLSHVPDGLAPGAPLVVALHGCWHGAAEFDRGAGWSVLARRHGFALLLPEQRSSNNAQGCFGWFEPSHAARGAGEAASIRAMVERMIEDHALDRGRVFVVGLSAGGAMAAALLASYPEVFAAGAVIAGLPFGAATGVSGAIEAMYHGRIRPAREWGEAVRRASGHRGPWPRLQVWHGTADATVVPANADELVKQWRDLHGLSPAPDAAGVVDGAAYQGWFGPDGTPVLESYLVPGLSHGVPIAPASPDAGQRCGVAGPHALDAGIASPCHTVRFWGLTGESPAARVQAHAPGAPASDSGFAALFDPMAWASSLFGTRPF